MTLAHTQLELLDFEPDVNHFLEQVLAGLERSPRLIPCKYLYDRRGSQLFDRICELPEYYPTRTELAIMRSRADEMAKLIAPDALLIEYGSGSSTKTPILLDALERPQGYVAIDISREHLLASMHRLQRRYPELMTLCVCADYTQEIALPHFEDVSRRVVYFPGSTIGNFHRPDAARFLARVRKVAEDGGGLLIGVDLVKAKSVLEAAYNDAQDVTAAFNLNLLHRINRELDGDFDLKQWSHHAMFNEGMSRIEMHLMSLRRQAVQVAGQSFAFGAGETIRTEVSYKYTLESFAELAAGAGFSVERVWTDPQDLFSVQLLRAS